MVSMGGGIGFGAGIGVGAGMGAGIGLQPGALQSPRGRPQQVKISGTGGARGGTTGVGSVPGVTVQSPGGPAGPIPAGHGLSGALAWYAMRRRSTQGELSAMPAGRRILPSLSRSAG